MITTFMSSRLSKNDCARFSAIRTKDNRIEILYDGKPWGMHNSEHFMFRRRIAILFLDSLDILSAYVDSEGEYPDWNGIKEYSERKHLCSVEKFGHDWQRNTALSKVDWESRGRQTPKKTTWS
jgi:hypothetical protein